jgi:hypothetical protein
MKAIKFLSMMAIAAITFNSCSDDDPAPVNEEEVITSVNIVLTPQGGGDQITLSSRDLDGDGPNAPIVLVSDPLATGTVYNGTVQFLNELEDPAEDKTAEILAEDEEHQVFFSVTGSVGSFAYTDSDSNGNPIGLTFTLTSAANTTSGVLTVVLRHQPDKDGAGVSDGNIANAGGETDIEVSYNVAVVN